MPNRPSKDMHLWKLVKLTKGLPCISSKLSCSQALFKTASYFQTCLNSPDPPPVPPSADQRMSATGYEETELTYNVNEEEQQKVILTNWCWNDVKTHIVAGPPDDVLFPLLVARTAHAQPILSHRLILLSPFTLHHTPPPPPCTLTFTR